MKIKTSYNLSKRNDQGEELIVKLEVEDEVRGASSQEEITKRIQAETSALMDALQGTGLGMNNADIQANQKDQDNCAADGQNDSGYLPRVQRFRGFWTRSLAGQ